MTATGKGTGEAVMGRRGDFIDAAACTGFKNRKSSSSKILFEVDLPKLD
jgi:hypothetical protein